MVNFLHSSNHLSRYKLQHPSLIPTNITLSAACHSASLLPITCERSYRTHRRRMTSSNTDGRLSLSQHSKLPPCPKTWTVHEQDSHTAPTFPSPHRSDCLAPRMPLPWQPPTTSSRSWVRLGSEDRNPHLEPRTLTVRSTATLAANEWEWTKS